MFVKGMSLTLGAALTTVLLFSACGDEKGESGGVVSGSGYEYPLPEGWRDASADQKSGDSTAEKNSFATAVTVGVLPVVEGQTLEDVVRGQFRLVQRAVKSPPLPEWRYKPPHGLKPTELDGKPAMQFDHALVIEGARKMSRKLTAVHRGRAYTLTLLGPAARFKVDRGELDEIVDAWRWQ